MKLFTQTLQRCARIRRLVGVLLMLGAAAGGGADAAAQVPTPGLGSTPGRDRPRAGALAPSFEFHSGFWINLHHFLYQQARLREQRPTGLASNPASQTSAQNPQTPGAPAGAQSVPLDGFSPDEKAAWEFAVDYYARTFAARDLLFDGDLINIKNRLAEIEADPDLQKSGLRPELIEAMEKAATVYRARWWPEHDRANRAWIAAVMPLVRQLGGLLAKQLSAVYQENWPAEKIQVDVSFYAHRLGAYTTLDPLHLTISSTYPNNQGAAAIEILFHEASHGLTSAVAAAISRECRARNKPTPRDLWHALLFYTTGEMVKRALAATSKNRPADAYTPYAYRHGLYSRGWQNYQTLLETYWQPYLNGETDFDRAIIRMVNAL